MASNRPAANIKVAGAGMSVNEDATVGTTVYNIDVTDIDAGDAITYFIIEGNDDNDFAINSSSGEITVNHSLDFETKASYILNNTSLFFKKPVCEVSPNPASKNIHFNLSDNYLQGCKEVKIFSFSGQLIFNEPFTGESFEMDISNFENGIYIYKIYTDKGEHIGKFIKD